MSSPLFPFDRGRELDSEFPFDRGRFSSCSVQSSTLGSSFSSSVMLPFGLRLHLRHHFNVLVLMF